MSKKNLLLKLVFYFFISVFVIYLLKVFYYLYIYHQTIEEISSSVNSFCHDNYSFVVLINNTTSQNFCLELAQQYKEIVNKIFWPLEIIYLDLIFFISLGLLFLYFLFKKD